MDQQTMLSAFRLMLLSRAFDDECQRILSAGGEVPNYHSARGQEAASAGLGMPLREDDYMQFGYRDFGMLLAKGVTPDELAGDLLLKTTGTTRGYGGIMHVSAPRIGIVGRNSVFGSRYGIAVGLAFSALHRGEGQVVISPFGEAEGARGPLYEAINFACVRRLPIVFVAQNNGYSISSRTGDLFAGGDMSSIWRGAPMPVSVVDGNDIEAVHAAAAGAVANARAGLGPALLEVVSYRIDGHIPTEVESLGAIDYQPLEEVEAWRAKDPIARARKRLEELGASDLDRFEQDVIAEARETFVRAEEAPHPSPETMTEYIYREAVPHA